MVSVALEEVVSANGGVTAFIFVSLFLLILYLPDVSKKLVMTQDRINCLPKRK